MNIYEYVPGTGYRVSRLETLEYMYSLVTGDLTALADGTVYMCMYRLNTGSTTGHRVCMCIYGALY